MNKKVAIIHPWMPQYRTRFFALLVRNLAENGIEASIFYGETPPEWKERNDSAQPAGMFELQTRFVSVGRRSVSMKSLREFHTRGPYDLVILEQAIRNLETYRLLFSPVFRSRVAYWGHGKTYTVSKNGLEEAFKRALTKRSRWFFAYTQGGVDAIAKSGYSVDRTTVVQNSTDTEDLRFCLAQISESEVTEFRNLHSLTEDSCIYIGGIDLAKRIPFLLDAARLCYEKNGNFRLVIVGAGDLSSQVAIAASETPYITYLGAMFGPEKALALKSCRLMLIPGRVGLVAVDSLVSGTPIVTTNWPYHAPEFEYLEDGQTVKVSSDDVDSYSNAVLALLEDPSSLYELAANCVESGLDFSAESMAMKFSDGVIQALA